MCSGVRNPADTWWPQTILGQVTDHWLDPSNFCHLLLKNVALHKILEIFLTLHVLLSPGPEFTIFCRYFHHLWLKIMKNEIFLFVYTLFLAFPSLGTITIFALLFPTGMSLNSYPSIFFHAYCHQWGLSHHQDRWSLCIQFCPLQSIVYPTTRRVMS